MEKIFNVMVLPREGGSPRIQEWYLSDILEEINRDRSDEWIDYDETDWREGWNEWVEGEFYQLIDKFEVGDVVTSVDFKLRCSTMEYDSAIVVSIEPFTLVSQCSTMKWQTTIKKEDFKVIGKADKNVLQNCLRRIN